MDRLACVDVPALPLQLLVKAHPDWAACPVAVVAEDRPQAPLLYANEKAWRARVLPGQRYAAALSLARDLRAGPVSAAEVVRGVHEIAERLRRHTPEVEPAPEESGVFWLNAQGLGRLHVSLGAWARGIRADLQGAGYHATVVVGFTRFGTYGVAKSGSGVKAFADPAEEAAAMRSVSLSRLNLEPSVREALGKLGIRTVGDFLRLPAEGIRERFGERVHWLHRLAAGDLWTPLVPVMAEEPPSSRLELEAPVSDAERLLFLIKSLLDGLVVELARRFQALAELLLRLALDWGGERTERLRPAAPTLDVTQILGLVRLRLETLRLPSGVVEIQLTAQGTPSTPEQIRLFVISASSAALACSSALAGVNPASGAGEAPPAGLTISASSAALACSSTLAGVNPASGAGEAPPACPREARTGLVMRPQRDHEAIGRAFARLRAEFGDEAVVRARLREAHLPAARFVWEPLLATTTAIHEPRLFISASSAALACSSALAGVNPASGAKEAPPACPREAGTGLMIPRPLVRRIYTKPMALPPRPRQEPDGWLLRGTAHGRVERLLGPYVVSGGWWSGVVRRDYYFARMSGGETLWIYYDRRRRRWFLEGRVE